MDTTITRHSSSTRSAVRIFCTVQDWAHSVDIHLNITRSRNISITHSAIHHHLRRQILSRSLLPLNRRQTELLRRIIDELLLSRQLAGVVRSARWHPTVLIRMTRRVPVIRSNCLIMLTNFIMRHLSGIIFICYLVVVVYSVTSSLSCSHFLCVWAVLPHLK